MTILRANRSRLLLALASAAFALGSVRADAADRSLEIYQTSRAGDSMTLRSAESLRSDAPAALEIRLDPEARYQRMRGFGGAFTESAAFALSQLPAEKRAEVLSAYFSPEGAGYSLMRTHIGSCDFSLGSYSYAPVAGDVDLEHFTIEHDRKLLLPLIKDAQAVGGAQFELLASPWTAPPWMKDNETWFGGSLKPEHERTFARYIAKYLKAYEAEGVKIWGLTPVNEPEGNDANWESLHFGPEEMGSFIKNHLGPVLRDEELDTKVYIFDQNRNHVQEWTDEILGDEEASQYVAGTAVHWYSSTVDYYGETLDAVHAKFPDFEIIQSEGCIDALGDDEPLGVWLESDWYWRKEATDWGPMWAAEEQKADHPVYVPVNRYVRDMIGCMNHWVNGWIDWNMVLDFRGGPNHVGNYCGAPVLVDGETQTVFYTPLYYAMAHFSRYIRPGAERIGIETTSEELMSTAAINEDGSVVAVVFNSGDRPVSYELGLEGERHRLTIPSQAIQTLVFR
ncbi:glycoside hydrolase family 30 protein [Pelagicoccus sp. SDUM812005]|uniref:glycoside hydrolase family 30 protein n=1 Tax=Pelagicoccus sp. SDUM812005 TaxID=3041257 RepID=UPI00280CFA02|nr:glycoside hydrolase family 30 protein [Pelagicoccus sp. SDUM812005]MDQ8182060.1 glycoside hydrolase family 30 protein [Pelagicoccus sp. SDUM812005]